MPPTEPEDILACLEAPPTQEITPPISPSRRKFPFFTWFLFAACLIVIAGSMVIFISIRPPADFPAGSYVTVEQGAGMSAVATQFAQEKLVRSSFWFKVVATLFEGDRSVKAGEYYFKEALWLPTLVKRLTTADFRVEPIRVTIPEGLSNREMAAVFQKSLPHFKSDTFLLLASEKEGYLFPDTYLFSPRASEKEIVATMDKTFADKILPLKPEMDAFGKPLNEVIIMASMLEEEARTTETRRTIAGILWKRLEIGMPLQVDAVFPYILGKNTYELTSDDLKVDSLYNTYLHTGLPPTPISNPGLDSIKAAVTPIESEYFYYLSDKNGEMHYAVTHDEHLANRATYLGK